ncbi:MAG: hypothetical protein RI935_432 [Candidatus Parcubacteria bacterium]
MAIEKYTTDSFVIESYDQGEHDKAFKLFTREFGLIIAIAKGIRKLESKLRAHIRPRQLSRVTLVRGKEVWRVVGGEEILMESTLHDTITSLINRFIKGQGPSRRLYDQMYALLEASASYDEETTRLLIHYVMLVELGYADAMIIGAKDITEYKSYTTHDLYTHVLLNKERVKRHTLQVLKESQL